jgi:hypothetical protein
VPTRVKLISSLQKYYSTQVSNKATPDRKLAFLSM